MVDEPSLYKELLSWITTIVITVALFFGRHSLNRSSKRQDDIEERMRRLERDMVTHSDLQRLEDKMDKLVDRLDRILERSVGV